MEEDGLTSSFLAFLCIILYYVDIHFWDVDMFLCMSDMDICLFDMMSGEIVHGTERCRLEKRVVRHGFCHVVHTFCHVVHTFFYVCTCGTEEKKKIVRGL